MAAGTHTRPVPTTGSSARTAIKAAHNRGGRMSSIQKLSSGKYRARYRDESRKEHARHFDRKVDAQRWHPGRLQAGRVPGGAHEREKRAPGRFAACQPRTDVTATHDQA